LVLVLIKENLIGFEIIIPNSKQVNYFYKRDLISITGAKL